MHTSHNSIDGYHIIWSNIISWTLWRRGVVVVTTGQLHSSKRERRFCAYSNPARGVSEIRDGEYLLQWSRLERFLFWTTESWKPQQNNGAKSGTIIMDLSKAFDNLNHNLLLTKIKAYGLDNSSVEFFLSYICSRFQRCKTNSFSQWKKVLAGALQGSLHKKWSFPLRISSLWSHLLTEF